MDYSKKVSYDKLLIGLESTSGIVVTGSIITAINLRRE